jgi:hypothetical protein
MDPSAADTISILSEFAIHGLSTVPDIGAA